jgi:ribonuclease HI
MHHVTVEGVTTSHDLIIATDGSSLGNPGAGGWSWYVNAQLYEAGGEPGPVTNNQMEITALIRALQAIGERDVTFEIDSRYVIDAVTKWHHGWRKRDWVNSKGEPVANRELFEQALVLLETRRKRGCRTELRWVRAHNGSPRNEGADATARAQAELARTLGRSVLTNVGSLTNR